MQLMMTVFAVTPEEILYGYGPLGVGVVALSFVGHKMFNILLKDRDKAISDRDAMIQDVFTKVLPAIARNTDVLEARQAIDRDLVDAVKENTKVVEEVRHVLRYGQNRVGGA